MTVKDELNYTLDMKDCKWKYAVIKQCTSKTLWQQISRLSDFQTMKLGQMSDKRYTCNSSILLSELFKFEY